MTLYWIILAYVLVMNSIAFALCHRNKRLAQADEWRIPERRLTVVAWLGGGIGAWMGMHRFHHKTHHLRFRVLIPLACILWCLPVGSMTWVALTAQGRIPGTPLMLQRAVEARHDDTPYKQQYTWVIYDHISPTLTRAVIASEDNLFTSHKGFSRSGIEQAWKERQQKGKVRHGGSTISQQTAKNVFTFGHRTWWRKMRETWYTLLIEQMWGKKRIMEVYLNVAEMGKGIYGAEAASQYYFHHKAATLKNNESALLAAVLPSPLRYSVSNPGPYMRKRQGQIIRLMPLMGKIELE